MYSFCRCLPDPRANSSNSRTQRIEEKLIINKPFVATQMCRTILEIKRNITSPHYSEDPKCTLKQ